MAVDDIKDAELLATIDHMLDVKVFNQNQKVMHLVDVELAGDANWYDPFGSGYIDPTQECPNRLILMVFLDKFNKKLIVKLYPKTNYKYVIPGGKPKVFEANNNAASRIFWEQTGIVVDKTLVTKIYDTILPDGKQTHAIVFLATDSKNDITSKLAKELKLHWIYYNELKNYDNALMRKLYQNIFYKLVQFMY